ncbi:MAG TPA: 30S ribosomal protein S3 [Sphingobacteriaceae bacterium]|nr:30S ribosomal protein S3 [Sphingobacteriaceae bacterium]
MGQKAHPIGNRLGIIKGWDSNWFGGNDYSEKLVEDEKIRKYIAARIAKGGISKVVIERTLKRITVTIHTARPGIVIGKGGQEVDRLKEELKKLTKKDVQINIFEIKRPELDAQLVGEGIAKQLEARISFRRAMKTSIASTMRMGAEGIKVMTSGRLGGAEMARTEQYKEGRIPLHTFRADIDYALAEAHTTYGKIGIKVWICKGEVYGKRDLSPNIGQGTGVKGRNEGGSPFAGGGDRRAGGDRRGGGGDRRGGDNRGGGPGQNRAGGGAPGQNRGGNAGGAGGFRGKK